MIFPARTSGDLPQMTSIPNALSACPEAKVYCHRAMRSVSYGLLVSVFLHIGLYAHRVKCLAGRTREEVHISPSHAQNKQIDLDVALSKMVHVLITWS